MNGKVKEVRVCITEIVNIVCGHGPGKFRHSAQISDVLILLPSCSVFVCVVM